MLVGRPLELSGSFTENSTEVKGIYPVKVPAVADGAPVMFSATKAGLVSFGRVVAGFAVVTLVVVSSVVGSVVVDAIVAVSSLSACWAVCPVVVSSSPRSKSLFVTKSPAASTSKPTQTHIKADLFIFLSPFFRLC